jgi:hypothetical protein
MKRLGCCCFVLLVLVLPTLVGAEETWKVHAQAALPSEQASALHEVFVSQNRSDETVDAGEDEVVWTWWSYSEETGSSWPDDDALYRRARFNLSLTDGADNGNVQHHQRHEPSLVRVNGEVSIVAAESNLRFIVFELEVTPLVNLSNQTIMHLVLTEDRAVDQHARKAQHLVRELRPEVGFSLKANNTTSMSALLSADHLSAAGVDLTHQPTGWSYTVAVFGGDEGTTSSELLLLKHERLPSPLLQLTPAEAWAPVVLTALAVVLIGATVAGMRARERTIPTLQAKWNSEEGDQLLLMAKAGKVGFSIVRWEVREPWRFKGRPPKRLVEAHQSAELSVNFKESWDEECHLEMAIEVEGMGGWRQHVWLSSPQTTPLLTSAKEEE